MIRLRGKLITIEGISGVGKTYYFNKLKKLFDKEKIIFNSEINDSVQSKYNKKIFDILTSCNSRFFDVGNPKMETLLIAAMQANNEQNFILPAIQEGMNVISDRGYDTVCILESIKFSIKYNTNLDNDVEEIYSFLNKYCMIPDKTILLIDDCDKCIARAEKRDKLNYNDKEKIILKKSYEYFLKMALKYNERYYIIYVNRLTEKEIVDEMISIIND